MDSKGTNSTRLATVADAATVAALDAFNREFNVSTPGIDALADRLARLLGGDDVVAVLTEGVPVGVGLLTLRPNVWHDGPVALLDELYVVPHLRGHGIGSALLTDAEKMTCDRGGQLLEINVDGDDVGRPPVL